MDTIETTTMEISKKRRESQSGFTLLETMLATLILGGALLALAGAFAQGMVIMSTSHHHHVAKEKASEAIESIFTARDTLNLDWDEVNNKSNGGIFLDGAQDVCQLGNDGLANTDDDGDVETSVFPGPDNQMNTADDVTFSLDDFSREMVITEIDNNLRSIVITIRYNVGHLQREYRLTSFISRFS